MLMQEQDQRAKCLLSDLGYLPKDQFNPFVKRVTAGCGFEFPSWSTKSTNSLSDETLNPGPV